MKNLSFVLLLLTLPTLCLAQTPSDAPIDPSTVNPNKPKLVHPVLAREHSGNGRIGIRLDFTKSGYPRIIGIIQGGPAYDFGLKYGDIILRIDKNDVLGMTQDEVRLSFHGDPDSGVDLVIQRNDDVRPINIAIKRRLLPEDAQDTVRPTYSSQYYNPSPVEVPTPFF